MINEGEGEFPDNSPGNWELGSEGAPGELSWEVSGEFPKPSSNDTSLGECN